MNSAATLCVFLAGLLIAMQAMINARLSSWTGLALFATVFSFIQLTASVVVLGGFSQWTQVAWTSIHTAPRWMYIGGILGVPILMLLGFGLSSMGGFMGMLVMLSGQMAAALVIDHFGLFGVPVRSISGLRIAGLMVVFLGLWISNLKTR